MYKEDLTLNNPQWLMCHNKKSNQSVNLRTSVLASRYSVRFSVTVLRRLFRRLMATRSSGVDHGLVYLPILGLPTCVLAAEIIEPQNSVSQGDWFRWVGCYSGVDSICTT